MNVKRARELCMSAIHTHTHTHKNTHRNMYGSENFTCSSYSGKNGNKRNSSIFSLSLFTTHKDIPGWNAFTDGSDNHESFVMDDQVCLKSSVKKFTFAIFLRRSLWPDKKKTHVVLCCDKSWENFLFFRKKFLCHSWDEKLQAVTVGTMSLSSVWHVSTF